MKLNVCIASRYIGITLEDGGDETVLRRFPWPANEHGRQVKLNEASEYAQQVGRVLRCPIYVDTALDIGVEVALLGLIERSHAHAR